MSLRHTVWLLLLSSSVAFTQPSITVVSAADFARYPLSPGALISIFGNDFSDGVFVASDQIPATNALSLGGASASVMDSTGSTTPLVLLAVTPNQINALIPATVVPGDATFTTLTATGERAATTLSLQPVGPSIFTADQSGTWLAAAQVLTVHADGTRTLTASIADCSGPLTWNGSTWSHCVPVPISVGSTSDQVILELFGTGIRGYQQLLSNCPQSCTAADGVTVSTGVSVEYAGAQGSGTPGSFGGLDQVNIILPPWTPKGIVNFYISVYAGVVHTSFGDVGMLADSNAVSIFIQ